MDEGKPLMSGAIVHAAPHMNKYHVAGGLCAIIPHCNNAQTPLCTIISASNRALGAAVKQTQPPLTRTRINSPL